MDINLGRIAAYVRLDLSQLKGDQDKAKRSVKEFSKTLTKDVSDSMTSLGQKMSLGITAPLLALGRAAVNAAKDFDSLKRGLTAVSGSSAETERQLKRLREVAKLPGLSFEQAVEGSTRLQAAGLSARLAERSLKAFGNALATVGKGSSELAGVNLALSQIVSKGKVSAEEINQIAERVPQIRRIMISAFGTADTEILQKAKITSQQFIQAIVGELERLPKVTGGIANSFENFNQTMRNSLVELGNAILPDLMRGMAELEKGIKNATQWWKSLDAETRQNIIRFAEFAAIAGPVVLALGSIVGAVNSLIGAIGTLKTVSLFLRTPGGLVGAGAIAALVGVTKVVRDLHNATKNSTANAADRDAKERQGNPKGYWQNQINAAKNRLIGQTDPAIISANQRMIARAEAELKKSTQAAVASPLGPPVPSPEQRMNDALKEQLRAQVKASQQAAAAQKAEAEQRKRETAARKAQSAAERQRRIRIGHAQAFSDLGDANERGFGGFLNDQLSEWMRQVQQSMRDRQNMRPLGATLNMFSEAMGMMNPLSQEAAAESAAQRNRDLLRRGGGVMGGIVGGVNGAMGGFGALAAKAQVETTKRTEIETQKRIALEDRYAQHQVRMGRLTLSGYQQYLQERLNAVRGNLEQEMEIEAALQQVRIQQMEQIEAKRYQGWQNVARGIENVFANAFTSVLDGSKDFFSALLDGFKQMIAQMLAQALAAGLLRSLFGGGNFLTGFLGVFGFDNGVNDSRARRWGYDFSHHFAAGTREYQQQRIGSSRMAASGGGNQNVSVQFTGPIYLSNDMDVDRLMDRVNWNTKNMLRRRVS
jgi:tape measure domain-containing protein